jgi:MFS family permease
MTSLLQELSKKAAERWAAILLGPGLLFVACALLAHHQGFGHALDVPLLRRYITDVTTDQANRDTAGLVLLGAVATVAAVVAGMNVAVVGRLVERLWIPARPGLYTALLVRWRRYRWGRIERALTAARTRASIQIARARLFDGDSAPRHFPRPHRLRARLDRYSEVQPDRPTWDAQRMAGVERRIADRYSLDLALVWPHVWTVADSDTRANLESVQENYATTARLTGWSLAYLLLFPATGWWPSVPLAVVLCALARSRARASLDTLAPLVESMVDVNVRVLAERLGVSCPETFTPDTAQAITALLTAAEA